MRFAVTGATGQMGGNIISKISQNPDHELKAVFDKEKTETQGLQVLNDDKIEKTLEDEDIGVLIDFTVPEATLKYLEAAENTETALVIGTTGFTHEEEQKIRDTAEKIPVLKASNFSLGINVLRELVKEAVNQLEDYDIEITETHHNRKTDSPSGTAKTILKDIKKVKDEEIEEVYGRRGESERKESEIGIHSLRAGDIKGSHEVKIAGNEEVLEIQHRSESREVFASGAIQSAEWLAKQREGFYTFKEVLKR
ncbi:MAG: 4-hydroxy-tetrahydrodipicolinate reductase [Candidatus Nanohaloarchaea archaeon]